MPIERMRALVQAREPIRAALAQREMHCVTRSASPLVLLQNCQER